MAKSIKIWTVRSIISNYSSLGLPHFQRGLVWNSDSVSLLLESLFYDTPCGSIVLWQPLDPEKEGVPLPDATKVRHLVIDGQQRIRSIHDALQNIDSDIEEEDEPEGNPPEQDRQRIWCVNLARIPTLAAHLGENALTDNSLFRKPIDPRRATPQSVRYNLVPLSLFLDDKNDNPVENWKYLKGDRDALAEAANECNLKARLRDMWDRELFVVIKKETQSGHHLADMVKLYNRINSGGMRVEAEEKAFATMVSFYPRTNEWLKELFCNVHGRDADKTGRDDMLHRAQERKFGFKLFIRTFVQAASYHFGYSIGSANLSFTVVNGWFFQQQLSDVERADELFAACARTINDITEVIRDELYCDSFQFLPETGALIPVFQLLLKYPYLVRNRDGDRGKQETRDLVALFILKLILRNYGQCDAQKFAQEIGETNSLAECVKIIRRKEPGRFDHLSERMAATVTLRDPYVLMLYWLVRKKGAKDFSYGQLSPGQQKALLPGKEVKIGTGCDPEKQHIVPYSKLSAVYDLPEGRRKSSHVINSIGNLTYISHDLNFFSSGLGSDPVDLVMEDEANLSAHFLGNRKLRNLYRKTITQIGREGAEDSKTRNLFEEFSRDRQRLILKGFTDWVKDLERKTLIEEPPENRTEPCSRLYWPLIEDAIRQLNYDNRIEDQLLNLCRHPRRVAKPGTKNSEDGYSCVLRHYELRVDKRKVIKVLFEDQHMVLCLVGEKLHRMPTILLKAASQLEEQGRQGVRLRPGQEIELDTRGTGVPNVVKILDKLNKLLLRDWGRDRDVRAKKSG